MKGLFRVVLAISCLISSHSLSAATFSVSPSADNDCGDLVCDFQSALFASETNGQNNIINLAAGIYDTFGTPFEYVPSGNHSLTIRGEGAGVTVLDGNGLEQVLFVDTTTASADSDADILIHGVSFRNGNSVNPGAGLSVLTSDADIRIERCEFEFNESTNPGGGSSFQIGGGGLSAATMNAGSVFVTDSRFAHNFAPQSGAAGSFTVSTQGRVLLEGNTYLDNSTISFSGPLADASGGGAVAVAVFGDLIVNRNVFRGNTSTSSGAGLLTVSVYGTARVTNNVVTDNFSLATASSALAGGAGVQLVVPFGSVALTNNTITGNRAIDGSGGGLSVVFFDDTGSVTASNNIIWGNTSSGGLLCSTSCNDIAVGDDFDVNNVGSSFAISHSNFSDIAFECNPNAGCLPNRSVDADSNLDENPLFANPALHDFRLSSVSPLLDQGDPNALGLPAHDFDGNLRIQGAAPDMGAFESAAGASATENCANNVDDDGDGLIDCLDPDCAGAAACQDGGTPPASGENCANNVDDDGDGLIDCSDPDCAGAAACRDSEAPVVNVSASGCGLAAGGSGSFASIFLLFAPLLPAVLRRRGRAC